MKNAFIFSRKSSNTYGPNNTKDENLSLLGKYVLSISKYLEATRSAASKDWLDLEDVGIKLHLIAVKYLPVHMFLCS